MTNEHEPEINEWMETSTTQHIAYNAIALAGDGNYGFTKKLEKKYRHNWDAAWEAIANTYPHIHKESAFRDLGKRGIRLILQEDADFPPPLREIAHSPFGIYVRGTLPTNTIVCAIVGTRKATEDGLEIASEFSKNLTRRGVVIISGLALGIDSAAHRSCLNEKGVTIAVLANGLDSIYPKYHTRLAEEIVASGGALISEYPPRSPTYPSRFLERNRIVSGLSRGTLVIEAPARSGSLATAHFALQQNRDVFVVPGSIKHINFKGSHELIRKGALLVTEADDIAKEWDLISNATPLSTFASEEERRIMEFLEGASRPVSSEELVQELSIPAAVVAQTLSLLVIHDYIKEYDQGYTISSI